MSAKGEIDDIRYQIFLKLMELPNDQLAKFQEFFGIKDPKSVHLEDSRDEAVSQIADCIVQSDEAKGEVQEHSV